MPTFMVELEHAELMQLEALGLASADTSEADESIQWLFSFLSADRHRTYCLFEAPSIEALHAAARRADLPTSAVIEVDRIDPDALARHQPGD